MFGHTSGGETGIQGMQRMPSQREERLYSVNHLYNFQVNSFTTFLLLFKLK